MLEKLSKIADYWCTVC